MNIERYDADDLRAIADWLDLTEGRAIVNGTVKIERSSGRLIFDVREQDGEGHRPGVGVAWGDDNDETGW
jgi:hypothetical protein